MPDGTSTLGDVLRYDDAPMVDNTGSVSPMTEIGSTGLKRATGIIDEEYLPALRGRKAVKVFKEMSQNDPIVGSMLFAIDKLIRQVEWRVEAPDNTPEATEAADFVEQCMDDMSHTWADMISECLSCLVYGWSWHEIVYKKRVGPWEKNAKTRSKYDDGKIGWRKMPIRSQETLLRWVFDDTGGIQGMVQLAPPYYQTVLLPIKRSLLFRTGIYKGNPEGYSILRNAYRPWFFKKRLEEFEAIGIERDLAGMPVASVPSDYMKAKKGSDQEKVYQAFKRMVGNVRRDEHEGLVLPLEYDPDTKQPLFKFELLSSGGSRQFDTNAVIGRYEQRILMTTLADFILVGHESVGSYALHVDKTGIFRAALNVITDAIADVFNRHAIPRLFEVNAWKLKELPRIVPNNVDPPDLSQLAQFMTAMGGLGMQWFPDPELEKFLRDTAHLPEIPDEMLEQKRAMAGVQQQFDVLGMNHRISAVNAGYTPDQAEMLAQAPPDQLMQQQDLQGQVDAQGQSAQIATQAQADQTNISEAQAQAQHQRQLEAQKAQLDFHAKKTGIDEKRSASEHQRQLMMAKIKQQTMAQQAKLAAQKKSSAARTQPAKKTASKPLPKKK